MFAPLIGAWLAFAAPDDLPRRTVPAAGALDCAIDPCATVLPGVARFERAAGEAYAVGLDASDQPVGWVALSTDVVDIKGYSGKPLVTLVGIDPAAKLTGARVVYHAEPILLVGIPVQALHDYVDAHAGLPVTGSVSIGGNGGEGRHIDGVSGATVTVLAETDTILQTGRGLAQQVGVLAREPSRPGHFVEADPWTWDEIVDAGALGRVQISAEEAGGADIDLWFGFADAPQVGIPLLGEHAWKNALSKLKDGQHLFVMFNAGAWSFKGSGFVRGGMFDRFRVEQGLQTQVFRDLDYTNLSDPRLPGAPPFREGGLYITHPGVLDPGAPLRLVLLASAYDGRGAFSRTFTSFDATWRAPSAVYEVEGWDPEILAAAKAWSLAPARTAAVAAWLLFVTGLFAARRWTTGSMARLKRLHVGTMAVSAVGLGFGLGVQPSVTQVLTLVDSALHGWRMGLFLSDPVLFLSWVFIAFVTVAWGRGVFCGWVCPFGAMTELLFKVGRKLGLPAYELPESVHGVAKYLRYFVFLGLLAAFLFDAQLGEQLAEVEPFKSTFYVPIWTRHPALIAWWLSIVGASMVWWRPYCRYVCPLGAALAAPSTLRISGPYRRDFCSKCKICTRGCEPKAIGPDGRIDPRECLSCMECEANWRDDQVCPPLVKQRRDRERAEVA